MRKTYTAVRIAAVLLSAECAQHGRALSAATGIPSGSLHPVLARMRTAGWLSDGWEDAALAHAEGRPPRRYYEVTTEGRVALAAMLAEAGGRFGVTSATAGRDFAVGTAAEPSRKRAGRSRAASPAPVTEPSPGLRATFACCKHCKHGLTITSHGRKCGQCP